MPRGKAIPRNILARIRPAHSFKIPHQTIAKVLGITEDAIRKHLVRTEDVEEMGEPPRLRPSHRKLQGTVANSIKEILRDRPAIGYRSIPGALADILPAGSWIPKPATVLKYLHRQGLVKKKLRLKPPMTPARRANRLARPPHRGGGRRQR